MAVGLADKLAAVAVAEVERDHMRRQLEDVEGVPAEVVAGEGVSVGRASGRTGQVLNYQRRHRVTEIVSAAWLVVDSVD